MSRGKWGEWGELDGVEVPIRVAGIEEYYAKREGSDRPEHVLF